MFETMGDLEEESPGPQRLVRLQIRGLRRMEDLLSRCGGACTGERHEATGEEGGAAQS